jgi:hypothetical protein
MYDLPSADEPHFPNQTSLRKPCGPVDPELGTRYASHPRTLQTLATVQEPQGMITKPTMSASGIRVLVGGT